MDLGQRTPTCLLSSATRDLSWWVLQFLSAKQTDSGAQPLYSVKVRCLRISLEILKQLVCVVVE